ncbi:ABC transporter permease subunit [Pacificimonas aurantium]|nr:ABC transporter permease subunit [Pacificimonas aurantium]
MLFATPAAAEITVASKVFTENVILGEMARLAIAQGTDEPVRHRQELGGTRVVFDAAIAGEVDVYPAYTGTLRYQTLASERIESHGDLVAALASRGLRITEPIGFSNNYAIAMMPERAAELGVRTVSDLKDHPDLIWGVENEFLDRADGWRALKAAYGLPHGNVRGLLHDLGYRALASGETDLIDAYTTDPQIAQHDLVLLEDDLEHFPTYDAVYLYRDDLPSAAVSALEGLAGALDEAAMQEINGRAQFGGEDEGVLAAEVVSRVTGTAVEDDSAEAGLAARIWARTLEHLALVGIALGAAILIALPVGILAARLPRFGNLILGAVGILQTIPSLALFVILIPLLGIGFVPTIAALFVYSLLPIVRNVHSGLTNIPAALLDSADALGLSRRARLRRVELPLAAPTIMAGIKTAAVIAVGLATLGAIIGAGGYGQPILTGIRLASTPLILEGAIPAAALALVIQGLFDAAERWVTPRGLRLKQARS